MNEGYIRLYRQLVKNPIWTQLAPAVLKVAIYFLLRANHKPSQWYDGKETVYIPAGGFITSYARTAEACNISIQQARDAFSHLSKTGTQFATYRRTGRWTLVTVLNWAAYQSKPNDGNTPENTLGTDERTGKEQQTINKELKNTPPTPSGEGELFDLNHLPFGTLDTLPEEKSVTKSPTGGQPQNGTAHQAALAAVARSIHARHPAVRRDCGVGAVEKQLAAILKHKHISSDQLDIYLRRVDANHAGMCVSEQWQKDGGVFAKALSNYLAPTKERYDVEVNRAAAPVPSAPRLMA